MLRGLIFSQWFRDGECADWRCDFRGCAEHDMVVWLKGNFYRQVGGMVCDRGPLVAARVASQEHEAGHGEDRPASAYVHDASVGGVLKAIGAAPLKYSWR